MTSDGALGRSLGAFLAPVAFLTAAAAGTREDARVGALRLVVAGRLEKKKKKISVLTLVSGGSNIRLTRARHS